MIDRSILCVPGHDERKLKRCRDFGAHRVMLDLEDGVPDDQLQAARKLVAEHARAGDIVRIRDATDLPCLVDSGFEGDLMLSKWTWNDGMPSNGRWGLIPCIESPRGVLDARELLDRDLPVVAIAWGAHDFLALAGDTMNRGGAMERHAMAEVALVAAALGVPAIDSPSASLDLEGVLAECEVARGLGFGAKGCMLPAHVAIVNEFMAPKVSQRIERLASSPEDGIMICDGLLSAPPLRAGARRIAGQA